MGYWENRQAQMMYEYMEDAEAVSQELADIYAKASRELNYRIQNIYEKYRDKHGLTDEEAKALLNTLHDKTDIDELRAALKNTSATDPGRAELLKQIESPAYRARIERLEQLQGEIDRMMRDVYDQEKRISTEHYVDLASNSYYREIYNIQRQAGFQFSFSAVDPHQLNAILASTWSGANYSERIWGNTKGLAKELKEQMILGLLTGKKESEMASELANKYGTGAFRARRLVRTESNFVNSQMQRSAYEECDADLYDFVAVLDLRTSEECRNLDGQTFRVEDMEPGKNCNPMHPFCRSTTTIHLDDETLSGLKRRARNPITGKNELIPASTNYQKWYEQNVANNPKARAAEKMIKNRVADQKQYERYKGVIGSDAGKTFDNFQDMKYNTPEEFAKIRRNYKTFKAIDGKTWSDEFKKKAKSTYKKFRKNDVEMSDHALARFLDRSKKAGTEMTVQSVTDQLKKAVNYTEDGKAIRFYDEIAAITSEDTGEVISLVRRKNPKSTWEVADDE